MDANFCSIAWYKDNINSQRFTDLKSFLKIFKVKTIQNCF